MVRRRTEEPSRPPPLPPWRAGCEHQATDRSLVSKESGEVRSFTIPRVPGENLHTVLTGNIDPSATLHTEELVQYEVIGRRSFAGHESVHHGNGEYVRDGVSTNPAEGFFSQLKRSIDGTHHHVSVKHLDGYQAEFDFRYSTRKASDSTRTRTLISKVAGTRLSHKPLQG